MLPVPVCPDCHGDLGDQLGALVCGSCRARWPTEDDFPKLFSEDAVHGSDRFMRLFYSGLPALHDPLTRYFFPWLQRDGSEAAFREGAIRELDLGSLRPRADGQPRHILEVGIGAGANLPFVRRALPPDVDVVYWGLDLSSGMLRQCRKRLPVPTLDVRLMLGDAHRLPFRDHVFDRVLHIGAIASYGDGATALAEMGRVAKLDTPIVVVDEQLDPSRRNTLRDKLAFRLLTFYDRNPHCPVEKLPRAAARVRHFQLSRFLYCLKFTMPSEGRALS